MTKQDLHRRVIEIARNNPPSEKVPYAFEKRIMARIAALEPIDIWAVWSKYLWQAAAPCVAIMIGMSVWTYIDTRATAETSNMDLETALLAPLEPNGEVW